MSPSEHDDLHDAELSRLYRELPVDAPAPALDERIRAEARRAVAAGPQRWWRPLPMTGLATAATVILAIGMVRYWQAEQPTELARAVNVTPAAEAPESPAAEVEPTVAPTAAAPIEAAKEVVAPVAEPAVSPTATVPAGMAMRDEAQSTQGPVSEGTDVVPLAAKPAPAAPPPATLGRMMAPGESALQRADEAPGAKAEADAMADRVAAGSVPAEAKVAGEAALRKPTALAAAPAEAKPGLVSAPPYEELVTTGRYVEALAHWDPAQMASASLQQKAEYDLLLALVHGPQAEAPLCPAEIAASKEPATQLCLILQQLRMGQPVADAQLETLVRRWRRAVPSRRYLERALRDLVRRTSP